MVVFLLMLVVLALVLLLVAVVTVHRHDRAETAPSLRECRREVRANQTGNTITGTGTAFSKDMSGGVIVFRSAAYAYITDVVSPTKMKSKGWQQTVPTSEFGLNYGDAQCYGPLCPPPT